MGREGREGGAWKGVEVVVDVSEDGMDDESRSNRLLIKVSITLLVG